MRTIPTGPWNAKHEKGCGGAGVPCPDCNEPHDGERPAMGADKLLTQSHGCRSLLAKNVIEPIFGVFDQLRDKRIDFVGGRGLGELERLVSSRSIRLR